MSKEAMKLALEALEWCHGGEPCGTAEAITALREALAEQPAHQWQSTADKCELEKVPASGSLLPAQQEPVAFPARKAVEREIERTANPTGMHLNDGKERVALPGGTLRHMLALIDRTPSPAQRTWVGLTDQEFQWIYDHGRTSAGMMELVEAKLKEKNT